MNGPTMAHATLPATFDRPTPLRRAVPLLLIVLLHLGFFALLQNGLLQRVGNVEPLTVITAMLFPPEPVTPVLAPRPAATLAPKPVSQPVVRPRLVVVRPAITPLRLAPAPAATAPAPVPAPAAPAPEAFAPAAPPVPAQPLVAAPANTGPRTVSSGVQYLQAPRPDYPAQSKRLGEEGKVVLRVLVNQQGMAERIEVQKSSGFARLDDAARQAVQQARFKPHLEDGRPEAVFAIVPITFRLDQ